MLFPAFCWEFLDHPAYSPDLPRRTSISWTSEATIGRSPFPKDGVEMAVVEWLRMQQPHFFRDGSFKPVPRWEKRINILVDYVEK
jgi:hypothetical protein